jgi:hypothetical protein
MKVAKVPDNALCYPPHLDPDWVLVDGAFNSWLGTVENRAGEEILDLTGWAVRDFAGAFAFAQLVVRTFNKEVLGIELEDY